MATEARLPKGVTREDMEDLARQKRIFKEREAELLARYPDKAISVCGGEIFVGENLDDATEKAEAAYPDRLIYSHAPPVFCFVN